MQVQGSPEVLDDRVDYHRIGCTHRQVNILDDVIDERTRQVQEKGYTRQHDDGHTTEEFVYYAVRRVGYPDCEVGSVAERQDIIEAIAVLLAAVESIDRKAQ